MKTKNLLMINFSVEVRTEVVTEFHSRIQTKLSGI